MIKQERNRKKPKKILKKTKSLKILFGFINIPFCYIFYRCVFLYHFILFRLIYLRVLNIRWTLGTDEWTVCAVWGTSKPKREQKVILGEDRSRIYNLFCIPAPRTILRSQFWVRCSQCEGLRCSTLTPSELIPLQQRLLYIKRCRCAVLLLSFTNIEFFVIQSLSVCRDIFPPPPVFRLYCCRWLSESSPNRLKLKKKCRSLPTEQTLRCILRWMWFFSIPWLGNPHRIHGRNVPTTSVDLLWAEQIDCDISAERDSSQSQPIRDRKRTLPV